MIVAMSSSDTRVVDPLDLQNASRERLLAEIGLLQHRYSLTDPGRLESRIRELEAQLGSQLESAENLRVAKHDAQVIELQNEIDDLKMSLLHVRDYARGCACLLYTSPSPRDRQKSRMPSSA